MILDETANNERRRPSRRALGALGIFVLFALFLSAPYWILGANSYVRVHDCADSGLPFQIWVASSLHSAIARIADLPLAGINTWAGGGAIPVNMLFFFALPGWLAYGLLMFVQRLIAGYFAYRLLRDELDASEFAAMWSGFFYALFHQAALDVGSTGFTLSDALLIPGIPFLLWIAGRAARRSRRWFLLAAAGIGALTALTGVYAFAPFVFLLLLGWFLWLSRDSDRTLRDAVFAGAIAIGTWLLLSLPTLYEAKTNVPGSHRADWSSTVLLQLAGGAHAQVAMVLTLLHDNGVPIALGMVAMVVVRSGWRRPMLATSVVLACLAVMAPLSKIATASAGVGGSFQFDRFYLLAPVLSAIAGGLGLDMLVKAGSDADRRLTVIPARFLRVGAKSLALVFVAALVVMTTRGVALQWRGGDRYSTTVANPAYSWLAQQREGVPWRAVTVFSFSQVQAGMAWASGIETADGYATIYPKAYKDYWSKVIEPSLSQDRGNADYFSDWGSRAYLFVPRKFQDGSPIPFDTLFNTDLLSLENVRYVLSAVPLVSENLRLVRSGGKHGVWVYENDAVLDRSILVHHVVTRPNRASLLDTMAASDLSQLSTTAYLTQADARLVGSVEGSTEASGDVVETQRLASGSYRVHVSSAKSGVLILTESFDMGWDVTVDGKPQKPFSADGAFIGIKLAPGTHVVSVNASTW
jgi:Protein of unknown function (DUF6044)/Bacterial membrane protein YfhO